MSQKKKSLKLSVIDVESGKTARIRVGRHTTSQTIQDMILTRLDEKFSRNIIGILIKDILNPLDTIYEVIEELDEISRHELFSIVFDKEKQLESKFKDDGIISNRSHLETFTFFPIGYLKSCFDRKNGCPRQGKLAPTSKGSIQIFSPQTTTNSSFNVSDSLEGLDKHSHVWIIFVFHANQEKAEFSSSLHGGRHIRAKVHPPRMDGKSIGVFATRSPHRFVPIGLTVAKIESVENDTIFLSGIDIIDGTPVLDIKPYIPSYDYIDDAQSNLDLFNLDPLNSNKSINQVIFTEEAENSLQTLSQTCENLNKNFMTIVDLIKEILLSDPRSVYRKEKCSSEPYGFHLDGLDIHCKFEENCAIVYKITALNIPKNKVESKKIND